MNRINTIFLASALAGAALAQPPAEKPAQPAAGRQPSLPFIEEFNAESARRWHVMTGEWQFADPGAKQTAPDFDCGAALNALHVGGQPFYLAVRFRPESDFTGAGLFFALPAAEKKNGGMMVRCDPGGRILWGWFDDAGTFNFYGEANYDDDGDREQTLAIAVDPAKNAFNLFHHGERIATNLRTFHTDGLVGIQSSGGSHTFLRFEVRAAGAEELEGLKAPGPYSRIVDVIGNEEMVVALRQGREFITAYDAQGQATLHGDAGDLRIHMRAADDARPTALAWDRAGADGKRDILVLGYGGRIIWRLGPDLKRRDIGGQEFVEVNGMQGTGLAVDRDGRIFITDLSIPGIRVLDPNGAELVKFGEKGGIAAHDRSDPKSAGKFNTPRDIVVTSDGFVIVADRENYTFVVYAFDPQTNKFTFVRNGPWIPYPSQIALDSSGRLLMAGTFEYYRSYGALRVMDLAGHGQRVFLGHTMGNMSDKVRVCQGPGGKYYLIDPDKDRWFILPPDFVEPLPEFAWTPEGVQLTVTKVDGSKLTSTSAANPSRDPSRDRQGASSSPERGQAATKEAATEQNPDRNGGVVDQPAQRLTVRPKEQTCPSWPPLEPNELTTYALPAAPPQGKRYVIDMPVLVAVFTQALNEKGERVTIDPHGVLERMMRELDPARHFYWLNSHGTLNLQFDYMLVDDAEAKVDGGWIQPTPARTLVNRAREKQGLKPISPDHSLIGIHPMPGFDPNATDDVGYVGGGGLTPYAYSGYALWNNGQSWLFAHEWGHQLDSYFEKSGFPEWWLNHPDGTVHIGRYGEHWDCNAFLCRRADLMNWLRFKFGTLRLVDDADADGLADNDPSLPLDEQRFGSDPGRKDTDGDGLGDLEEMTASTFTSSDPRKADTDGDGVPDAQDPHPSFAVGAVLKPLGMEADGSPRAVHYAPLGRIEKSWCAATVRGAWDADHVYLLVALAKPVKQVIATIDFDNDGWFVGQDNVMATVDLEWPDGTPTIKRAVRCEATLYPQLANAADILPAGAPVLSFRVPRPETRAELTPDTLLSLTVRCQNGGGTIAFLVDPWQLLSLRCEGVLAPIH